MRKLEKSERRRSERNSFLACSFSAARVVRSGEANAYFLNVCLHWTLSFNIFIQRERALCSHQIISLI